MAFKMKGFSPFTKKKEYEPQTKAGGRENEKGKKIMETRDRNDKSETARKVAREEYESQINKFKKEIKSRK